MMTLWLWVAFTLFILALLAIDLGIFNRKSHVIKTKEALAWTGFWVALAFAFNVLIFYLYENHWLGVGLEIGHELSGKQAALQFFTGYIIEKSLSVDNIFIIALIFGYFRVPLIYQHRVLFWGVVGALVFRGIMIALGSILISRFDWIVYVFGVFLMITAIKMLIDRHDNLALDKNPIVKLVKRFYPVTHHYDKEHFFTRSGGKKAVTPLFLALVVVESTDIVFAIDSIPAIFAITRDPFLVFTSNVFALLGLRSLYFALAGLMDKFRYLKISLVFVLAFVGIKMLLIHHYPIPNWVSLVMIFGILSIGIFASLFGTHRDTAKLVSPLADNLGELAILTWKKAKRVVILVLGSTVLLIGIAMIALPGPAFIVIPAGLAILSTEFIWAKKLLKKIKEKVKPKA